MIKDEIFPEKISPEPQLLSTKYFCSFSLQVIVVDWNENTVAANRDNALILKKWEGDNTDRQLIGLTQLLQGIF